MPLIGGSYINWGDRERHNIKYCYGYEILRFKDDSWFIDSADFYSFEIYIIANSQISADQFKNLVIIGPYIVSPNFLGIAHQWPINIFYETTKMKDNY